MQGILFIDIETVPQFLSTAHMPNENMILFNNRFRHKIDVNEHVYYDDNAALYAEHNQIISISMGVMRGDKFFVRAFTGRHEREILSKLAEKIIEYKVIAGHNIKEFDCPILMRRFLINGLPVPSILDSMNKKPWEVPYYDTMTMWGGSQWNYKVSLDLLCNVLGISSPKKEMQGEDLGNLYYSMFDGVSSTELPFEKEEEVLGKIAAYNNADNIATARVYARLKGLPVFEDSQIEIIK
jgi:3'-5' exonuclease